MAEHGTEDERRKRRVALFLFLLVDSLIVIAVVAVLGWHLLSKKGEGEGKADETAGGRYEFSAFYHASNGEWILEEPETHVLKERKYVSSQHELPHYLVRTLPAGTRVRIVSAMQRWKEVEALEGGKVLCRGWVDAHNIRKAQKCEPARQD